VPLACFTTQGGLARPPIKGLLNPAGSPEPGIAALRGALLSFTPNDDREGKLILK
jgi:hypothetical protein